jgi:hypothetical protein
MNWVWVRDKMRSYPTDLYPAGRVGYGWNEEQTNRCGAHLIAAAIDRQEGVENGPACAAVAAGAGEPQPPSSRAYRSSSHPQWSPRRQPRGPVGNGRDQARNEKVSGCFFFLSLSRYRAIFLSQ